MQFHNHDYNKKLQSYANELRKEMTKAEACLWKYVLKAGQLKGFKFRRQRPVLNYIADFMCIDLKLIIEVDGITHQWETTATKDRKKDANLKAAGYTVLRFTDEEVLNHIHEVFELLNDWIEKNHPSRSTPSTTSS